ncbi:MAG TPA: hypothetical protein VGI76_08245 [Solirubrobacteraceae bacterium]
MDLDRQSIEKRDFPIARRGYDPVAVDAHLRALAAEVQELREQPIARTSESLGSAAASQVQGILEAAETTAAEIERSATDDAARMRYEAAEDAERTRNDAVQRAQTHVAAVAHATAALLVRVESMDGEVGALVQSIQASAGRLATDLGSVEGEMGQLYDAAAGRIAAGVVQGDAAPPPMAPAAGLPPQHVVSQAPPSPAVAPTPVAAITPSPVPPSAVPPVPSISATAPDAQHVAPRAPTPTTSVPRPVAPAPSVETARTSESGTIAAQQPAPAGGGDLDGARLVALNMALNGESREQADRYLRENYQLSDRAKLLDEVYAAIEV